MSKPRIPAITDAESRVMERLWETAPQGSEELAEALRADTGWHENTVRTLLGRLVRKGAVRATREGRRYLCLVASDGYGQLQRRQPLPHAKSGRTLPECKARRYS